MSETIHYSRANTNNGKLYHIDGAGIRSIYTESEPLPTARCESSGTKIELCNMGDLHESRPILRNSLCYTSLDPVMHYLIK